MLKQISIIAENKIGSMGRITSAISDAGIDLYNVVTNDSAEFGITRVLCDQPEKARDILRKEGYICNINMVVGAVISEKVGSLAKLLRTMRDMHINVDYMYVCYIRSSTEPVAIMHVQETEEVEMSLTSRGYKLL